MTTHRRQNDFFYCMGMERGKRRRAVKKEVQNIIRIPLVLGGSMGLIYAGCYQRTYQPLANGDDTFWKFWVLVIVLYIFVICASTWLLSLYLVKKVEEETKHERH